jgi:hypothetical protein
MKYRPPRMVFGMPSAPWWPCPAARPPAGEPKASKRGHDEDTAQEQKMRAPERHPPPPASAPSAAASACSVVRAPCRSPALPCARRAAPAGVLRPVVMACARSNVPQAGGRRPRRMHSRGGGRSRQPNGSWWLRSGVRLLGRRVRLGAWSLLALLCFKEK